MTEVDKPLSMLVAQGWEIVGYTHGLDEGLSVDCFLLRRQKQHKLVKVRPKWIGKGYAIKELDL